MLLMHVCYCLPTNPNNFNQCSVDSEFSLSIPMKNMFCLRSERSSVIGSDACGTNQIEAQIKVANFVKG